MATTAKEFTQAFSNQLMLPGFTPRDIVEVAKRTVMNELLDLHPECRDVEVWDEPYTIETDDGVVATGQILIIARGRA
jgi:hypothetical protein